MRLPITRDDVVRLGRFVLVFEGIALLVALALGVAYAGLTRTRLGDAFALMTIVLFLLIVFYAVLAGPGMFLSRPRLAPTGPEGRTRWHRWLAAPTVGRDREFFELVLFTIVAFLLLVIATGLGALLKALGA